MSQESNKPKFSHWFAEQRTRSDDIGALARKYTKKLSFYMLTDVIEAQRTQGSSKESMIAELTTACKADDEYQRLLKS